MARLLFLTARLPYPPREGHQLRSWHVLRALADVYEVTLLSFMRSDESMHECQPLLDRVVRVETFPIPAQYSRTALMQAAMKSTFGDLPFVAEKYASAQMRQRILELLGTTDLIHVDMLPLMGVVDGVAGKLPVVLNAHNVEHLLLQQRAAIEPGWPQRLFLRSQLAKLKIFERDACRRADRILACSSDDARHISLLAPQTPVCIVPNGVDVERNRPGGTPPQPAQLVFVGQMGWFPNRDGVQWFLGEVFPHILAVRADAEFVLVGKCDGLHIPEQVRAHVRVLGFVDEVAPAIQEAAIYVVPLRTGSGTRLKVLEAMAFAKPIVTTSIGSEGIDLEPGHDALYADSAKDFAAAVLALIADPDRAARMGVAARCKAEALYDWSSIGRRMLPTYAQLLRNQGEARAARQR